MKIVGKSILRLNLARNVILWTAHIVVLILSILLIYIISRDTLRNGTFYMDATFMKWQLWICIVFIADYFIEMLAAKRKWHYFWTHLIFLLVSIPYQYIMQKIGWPMPRDIAYLIRYMPLIRGGYAMAYVISWFTSDKATGLFLSYIITMLSTVYFCSLTFYLFENHVNPQISNYIDALWWSCMAVTTEGCNIDPVTGVGRALGVLLSVMGVVMFPVFTVYVTNLINRNQKNSVKDKLLQSYRQLMENGQQEQNSQNIHSSGNVVKTDGNIYRNNTRNDNSGSNGDSAAGS